MSSGASFYYRQSVNILLRTRWIGPYLLIPPLLAFVVYAESYLSVNGITQAFTSQQRAALAIWNGSLIIALIAGIKSCLFFSRLWGADWFLNSLSLPVKRSWGFWGPFMGVLTVATGVFALTTSAVIAALPDQGAISIAGTVADSWLTVFWAVSMCAFLGVLTSGGAGALFFSALLTVSLISQITMLRLPGWVYYLLPPAGKFRYPAGIGSDLVLAAHALLFLALARLLYRLGTKRR